jgi:hypothetical protein
VQGVVIKLSQAQFFQPDGLVRVNSVRVHAMDTKIFIDQTHVPPAAPQTPMRRD